MDLGTVLIWMALAICVEAIGLALYVLISRNRSLLKYQTASVYCIMFLITASFLLLAYYFMTSNLHNP